MLVDSSSAARKVQRSGPGNMNERLRRASELSNVRIIEHEFRNTHEFRSKIGAFMEASKGL